MDEFGKWRKALHNLDIWLQTIFQPPTRKPALSLTWPSAFLFSWLVFCQSLHVFSNTRGLFTHLHFLFLSFQPECPLLPLSVSGAQTNISRLISSPWPLEVFHWPLSNPGKLFLSILGYHYKLSLFLSLMVLWRRYSEWAVGKWTLHSDCLGLNTGSAIYYWCGIGQV